MKVMANCSFCGALTMFKGETRDLPESAALSDLIKAGYVSPCEQRAELKKAVKSGENKRGSTAKG